MKKRILSLLVALCMLSTISPVFAAGFTAEVADNDDDNVIYIYGNTTITSGWEYFKKSATLTIYDSDNSLCAIDQVDIADDGDYVFKVTVPKSDSYTYKIRAGAEDVSTSVNSSYIQNSESTYEINVFNNNDKTTTLNKGDTAGVVIDIVNKYRKAGDEFTIILAQYDEVDKLLGTEFSDTKSVPFDINSAQSFISDMQIADNAAYMKVFVFKDTELIQPVTISKMVKTNNTYRVHVSPDGNDANDGSFSNPVKTIAKAQTMARTHSGNGEGNVNVIFKEGTYELDSTINFTSEDSGTETEPVIYMAQPGKKVNFTMAKKMRADDFTPVTGDAAARINKKAEGKVLVYDLTNLGVPASNYAMETGGQMTYSYYPPSIFLNNKEQSLSRWPSDGWNYFTEVLDGGGTAQSVWNKIYTIDQVKDLGATFRYDQLNPSTWSTIDGAYIVGYFGTVYRSEWAKLRSINQSESTITLDHYTAYGVSPNHRWAIVNLLEEIDMPGEWCIDSNNAKLYYWPTKTFSADDEIEITTSMNNIVNMKGAQNIIFDGITFEKTRASGVYMEECDNIIIRNCEIRDIVRTGLTIKTCTNVDVKNNIIRDTGEGGIRVLRCGDLATLTPANINITNNIGYNMAKLSTLANGFYADAETFSTNNVGVFMTHNTISRSDIGIGGGYQLDGAIAYNEMFDAIRNASDAGMFYCGRTFTNYDNNYEYNYIHDIGSITKNETYPVCAFFMDDLDSGHKITNNIIVPNNKLNTGGVKIGGGRDNTVQYNTIVGAQNGIILENRTSSKSDDYIRSHTAFTNLVKDDDKYHFNQEPWISKHPGVAEVLNDYNGTTTKYVPKNNVVTDNVLVDCDKNSLAPHIVENGKVENNPAINEDIFVDSANQDYRITFAAKAKYNLPDRLIYEDFDLDKIGATKLAEFEKDFNMTYPQNGATGVETREMWLAWELQDFANEYYYTIATDAAFENIVDEGVTFKNCVEVPNLENNKTYYWKVSARNRSRRQQGEWESNSGVWSFTTATQNTVIKNLLGFSIQNAEAKAAEIVEGTELSQYKAGTKQMLLDGAAAAKSVYDRSDATQTEVDSAAARIVALISQLPKYRNLGYVKMNVGAASEWKVSNTGVVVTDSSSESGAVEFARTNDTEGTAYRDEIYSGAGIVCFDMKVTKYGSYPSVGLSIKQRWPNVTLPFYASTQSAYHLRIDKGYLWLTRYNQDKNLSKTLINGQSHPIKEGEWHSIQFGAVPTEQGTYIILNVDGKEVFNYRDTEAPFYDDGYVTIRPPRSTSAESTMLIRESASVPTDAYKPPAPSEITSIYTTQSVPEFIPIGAWTIQNGTGYDGKTASYYSSSDSANSVKWTVDEGQGTGKFKVYFWNDKTVNTDKNATVKFTSYMLDDQKQIDMTAQAAGWVEVGTYEMNSAQAHMEGSVEFIPSGNGTLSLSAVKFVKQ